MPSCRRLTPRRRPPRCPPRTAPARGRRRAPPRYGRRWRRRWRRRRLVGSAGARQEAGGERRVVVVERRRRAPGRRRRASQSVPPSIGSNLLQDLSRISGGMVFGCKSDTFGRTCHGRSLGCRRRTSSGACARSTASTLYHLHIHLLSPPPPPTGSTRASKTTSSSFLFNYSSRELMGIFRSGRAPRPQPRPGAWRSNYAVKMKAPPGESPFPAQLRWRTLMRCRPLKEHLWRTSPRNRSRAADAAAAAAAAAAGPPTTS